MRWEVGSKSCRAGGKAWCASGTLIGGLRASHGSETAQPPARQQRSRMSPAPVTHTRGLQAMPGDGPGDRHRGSGKGSRRRMSTAKGPAWLVLALVPFMDHRRWHPEAIDPGCFRVATEMGPPSPAPAAGPLPHTRFPMLHICRGCRHIPARLRRCICLSTLVAAIKMLALVYPMAAKGS